MKQLCVLTNLDRARELNRLLPDDIKPMLEFVQQKARHVVETKLAGGEWTNTFLTRDNWIDMAKDVLEDLDASLHAPRKSPGKLLETMMGAYGYLFLIHGMVEYHASEDCKSKPMKAAIELYFIADKA